MAARCPVANRLGGEGEGYKIALSALGEGRISIAAACVGIARAGLEAAARYLQQRKAFGAPLVEQQGIRFMLAEMAREVAAARAVTRAAAAAKDRGEPLAEVSSIAKWTASDAAMRVATDAVQLFGASGYSRETGVERLMRDAKGAQIYEGTNQIHRLIVADEVLKGPRCRFEGMTQPIARPERPRLSRQRRADADRQVRRRARPPCRRRSSVASRSGRPSSAPAWTRPRAQVDEVLMGQVLQAGVGQAPARQAALKAGLPNGTSATTINRVCGSGLKAIMLAAAEIRAGDAELAIAGGMESMNGARTSSRAPASAFASATASSSTRPSTTACGARSRTATWAPTPNASRSRTTSAARTRTPSRSASHQKAIAAIDAGRFDAEMAPVTVRDAKGRETVVQRRRGPAPRLVDRGAGPALKPAFALPDGEDRGDGDDRHGHRRQRARASPTAPPRRSSPASGRSSGSA